MSLQIAFEFQVVTTKLQLPSRSPTLPLRNPHLAHLCLAPPSRRQTREIAKLKLHNIHALLSTVVASINSMGFPASVFMPEKHFHCPRACCWNVGHINIKAEHLDAPPLFGVMLLSPVMDFQASTWLSTLRPILSDLNDTLMWKARHSRALRIHVTHPQGITLAQAKRVCKLFLLFEGANEFLCITLLGPFLFQALWTTMRLGDRGDCTSRVRQG